MIFLNRYLMLLAYHSNCTKGYIVNNSSVLCASLIQCPPRRRCIPTQLLFVCGVNLAFSSPPPQSISYTGVQEERGSLQRKKGEAGRGNGGNGISGIAPTDPFWRQEVGGTGWDPGHLPELGGAGPSASFAFLELTSPVLFESWELWQCPGFILWMNFGISLSLSYLKFKAPGSAEPDAQGGSQTQEEEEWQQWLTSWGVEENVSSLGTLWDVGWGHTFKWMETIKQYM